jgi:transcriptional regulator with GAF, ATPase, and Fis domain
MIHAADAMPRHDASDRTRGRGPQQYPVDAGAFLGKSANIVELVEEAQHIAPTDSKVLITGESGVGKELFARMIHQRSHRARQPMITINCGGVPETLLESELFGHVRGSFTDAHRDRRGLLEMANGGTVMLDEVGEMSLRMQTLLLRFLDSGEIQRIGSEGQHSTVDVRIISATNRDLFERTRTGEFREDLYYRLNVVHLLIPPLRARVDDIRPLFEHFLGLMGEQHGLPRCQITSEAATHLENYKWPGNIRELKNVAERVALRYPGSLLTPLELSAQIRSRGAAPVVAVVAASSADALAAACYARMTTNGESFWQVVYEPFMLRDLTRETVRAVVRLGLTHTRGSYRLLGQLFNWPATDYKRFLNFLQKYDCHMPFQNFRVLSPKADVAPDSTAAATKAG